MAPNSKFSLLSRLTKFFMPISMGKKPKRLIKSEGRIKLTKEAIMLTIISMEKPMYWPKTTLVFWKVLLLKKATRRKRSSKFVAMKADKDMVNIIKLSMPFFMYLSMIKLTMIEIFK